MLNVHVEDRVKIKCYLLRRGACRLVIVLTEWLLGYCTRTSEVRSMCSNKIVTS